MLRSDKPSEFFREPKPKPKTKAKKYKRPHQQPTEPVGAGSASPRNPDRASRDDRRPAPSGKRSAPPPATNHPYIHDQFFAPPEPIVHHHQHHNPPPPRSHGPPGTKRKHGRRRRHRANREQNDSSHREAGHGRDHGYEGDEDGAWLDNNRNSDSDYEEDAGAPLFGSRRFKHAETGLPRKVYVVSVTVIVFVSNVLATLLVDTLDDDDVPSEMGIDSIQQGLELSLEQFISIMGVMVAGALCRQPYKRVLTWNYALMFLSALLIGLHPDTSGYMSVRVLNAFYASINVYCGVGIVVLQCPRPFFRALYLGFLSCSSLIGVVCGPPLGKWASEMDGSRGLAICLGLILVLSGIPILLIQRLPPRQLYRGRTSKPSVRKSAWALLRDGRVVVALVVNFSAWSVFSIWTSVLPWHFHLHHTKHSTRIQLSHQLAIGVSSAIAGLFLGAMSRVLRAKDLAKYHVVCACFGFLALLSTVALFATKLGLLVTYAMSITSGLGMGQLVVALQLLLHDMAFVQEREHGIPACAEHVFLFYLATEYIGVICGRLGGFSAVALFGYAWGQLSLGFVLLCLAIVCVVILKDYFDRRELVTSYKPRLPT